MEHEREIMDVAIEAGHILLENGAEIFRVEETVYRISRHYGLDSGSVFTLSNGIFVTADSAGAEPFAKVIHVPVGSAHLDRVAAVNQLSREIEEGKFTVSQARAELERIRHMPGKTYRMQVIGAAMGSAGFAYIYGGSPIDSLAAFIAGAILYIYILSVSRPYLSKMVGSITGGAIATAASILLYKLGLGENLDYIVIGAVVSLIPGVAFTNAIRDITDENYLAGVVRMLDALLVFFCIAMGVGLVYAIMQRLMGGVVL